MKNRLIGYRVKRTLKVGDMVANRDSVIEEVYEPLSPLEELADLAWGYAHFRNDSDLANRIDELVIELTPPKLKEDKK